MGGRGNKRNKEVRERGAGEGVRSVAQAAGLTLFSLSSFFSNFKCVSVCVLGPFSKSLYCFLFFCHVCCEDVQGDCCLRVGYVAKRGWDGDCPSGNRAVLDVWEGAFIWVSHACGSASQYSGPCEWVLCIG